MLGYEQRSQFCCGRHFSSLRTDHQYVTRLSRISKSIKSETKPISSGDPQQYLKVYYHFSYFLYLPF